MTVDMNSKEYQKWLAEQERLDNFEYEQIEKSNIEENLKWAQAEEIAIRNWNCLLEKKKHLIELNLQQEAKRRLVNKNVPIFN